MCVCVCYEPLHTFTVVRSFIVKRFTDGQRIIFNSHDLDQRSSLVNGLAENGRMFRSLFSCCAQFNNSDLNTCAFQIIS